MGFNTYPPNPFPPNSENAGGGSPYVLPTATADTLGGVKIGSNISIDENGAISTPLVKGVVGIHKSDYDNLTDDEKNNGSLYMADTYSHVPSHAIDMSNITKYEEGNTTITATSATKTTIATNGGAIGAVYYYTDKIDVTDIDKIIGQIKATAQYTPFADRLSLTIGLAESAPATYPSNYTDLNYSVYDKTTTTGEKDFELDTSELTGEFYIVVYCPGWTATIENLKDDSTEISDLTKYEMFYKSTKILEKNVS